MSNNAIKLFLVSTAFKNFQYTKLIDINLFAKRDWMLFLKSIKIININKFRIGKINTKKTKNTKEAIIIINKITLKELK